MSIRCSERNFLWDLTVILVQSVGLYQYFVFRELGLLHGFQPVVFVSCVLIFALVW